MQTVRCKKTQQSKCEGSRKCWQTQTLISWDKSCWVPVRKPSVTCHQTHASHNLNTALQIGCLDDFKLIITMVMTLAWVNFFLHVSSKSHWFSQHERESFTETDVKSSAKTEIQMWWKNVTVNKPADLCFKVLISNKLVLGGPLNLSSALRDGRCNQNEEGNIWML